MVDCLARMGEEDGVFVLAAVLQAFESIVALRDAVGVGFFLRVVQGVDLLPENGAFQRPAGFPLLLSARARRQGGIRQQLRQELVVGESWLAVIFSFEPVRDVMPVEESTGVEPGLGIHRRYMGGS